MNYKIGFPVDGGCVEKTFFVEVQLTLSQKHHCTSGRSSRLRPKSGAEFVFNCAPLYIQSRYKFEFTPIPMPNPSTRPDTIASSGYSDALACALALEKSSIYPKAENNSPLVLLSCSFLWHQENRGLKNLKIERVISDESMQKKSLYNKWMITQKSCAKALFLHEKDAQVLHYNFNIPLMPLRNLTRVALWNRKTPIVVSCGAKDYNNIRKLLVPTRKTPYVKYVVSVITLIILAITVFLYSKKSSSVVIENIAQKLTISKTNNLIWNKKQWLLVQEIDDDELLKSLQSKDWRVWFVALKIIGKSRKNSQIFIEPIMKNLCHKRFQKYAVHTLLKLQPSFEQMLSYTQRENFMISRTAIHVIQQMKIENHFPTTDTLKKYLQHKKSQEVTLELIWRMPRKKNELLPRLLDLLSKKLLRESTAQAICSIQKNVNVSLLEQLKNNTIPQETIFEILQVTSLEYPLSFQQLELLQENYPVAVADLIVSSQNMIMLLDNLYKTAGSNNRTWSKVLVNIRLEKRDKHLLPLITNSLRKEAIKSSWYAEHLLRFIREIGISTPQINDILIEFLANSTRYKSSANTIVSLYLQTPAIKKALLFHLQNHDDKVYFSEICGKLNIAAAISQIQKQLKEDPQQKVTIAIALANLKDPKHLYEILKSPQDLLFTDVNKISHGVVGIVRNNKNLVTLLKICYENYKHCDSMSLPLLISSNNFQYLKTVFPKKLSIFFKHTSLKQDDKITLLKMYTRSNNEQVRIFALWQLYLVEKNAQIFVDYLDQVPINRRESIEYCLRKCEQLKPKRYKQALKKIARYPFYWKYRAIARKFLSLR